MEKETPPLPQCVGLRSNSIMQVSVHFNLTRVRNCRYDRTECTFKTWKAERLKIDISVGLNLLYNMSSERALVSNSASPMLGRQS